MGLGVEIRDEYRITQSGQRCGQIDGGGGFAYPSFLIDDADDVGDESLPSMRFA